MQKKPVLKFDYIQKKTTEFSVGHSLDFFALFAYIKTQFENCYLFESLSHPRHQDRFHTIGFSPAAILYAKSSSLTIEGKQNIIEKITNQPKETVIYNNINPYDLLKDSTCFQSSSNNHQGGLIGYLCHETVNYFESKINLKEHSDFSTFKFGFYTDGLTYDTLTETLSYYTFDDNRLNLITKILALFQNFKIPKKLKSVEFLGQNSSKEQFCKSAKNTQNKIKEGYSFQAEVGLKSYYNIKGDKISIYNKLRKINPGPYMFYLKFGSEELLGSSPEILASHNQGMVLTTPTAGTISRGKTKNEDIILARKLLNDSKEISEHNMLVDLHRNDLARVCIAGTVKVSDLMYIIKFSHVQHIVSNIIGKLKKNRTSFDLLKSLMPGGVVTGAPKIETIKIIDNNEQEPRGPYGGAVGRFTLNGDCDFCLPIRSLFCKDDKCFAQTSAGIVYDSIPEKEYTEINHKLAAMHQTLTELSQEI